MKDCRLSKKNNNHARNIAFSIAVIGIAFILIDAPITEAFPLIIAATVLISVAVGVFIGHKITENNQDIYSASDAASNWDKSIAFFVGYWNNSAALIENQIDNKHNEANADFLYYGRLSENKVASYVDQPIFNDKVKNNLSIDLMTDYCSFIYAQQQNFDLLADNFISTAEAMDNDLLCPVSLTYKASAPIIPHSTVSNSIEIKMGNYIETDGVAYQYWINGKVIGLHDSSNSLFNVTIVDIINNITIESGEIDTSTSTDNFYELELNSSLYSITVNEGDVILQGAIPNGVWHKAYYVMIDKDFATANANKFDANSSDGIPDYVRLYNSLTSFSTQCYLVDYTESLDNIILDAFQLNSAILIKSQIRFSTYKLAGYNNITDIPETEIIPPVDALWYDLAQMSSMNYTELYAIWLSYLTTLNDTDYNYVDTEITPYTIPFTNAELVANLTLSNWNYTYNAIGTLTGKSKNYDLITNSTVIIIPLETSLPINKSDNKRLQQNVYVFDIVKEKLFSITVNKSARINAIFEEYIINVSNLYNRGVNITNGTYIITDVGDYIESEFDIIPFEPTQVTPAYSNIILIAGAGLFIGGLVLTQFDFSKDWAMLVAYLGILVLAGWVIYYYVYPYFTSWWIGWWPF